MICRVPICRSSRPRFTSSGLTSWSAASALSSLILSSHRCIPRRKHNSRDLRCGMAKNPEQRSRLRRGMACEVLANRLPHSPDDLNESECSSVSGEIRDFPPKRECRWFESTLVRHTVSGFELSTSFYTKSSENGQKTRS